MFWERPWILLLWIAAPAIALLLHRARGPRGSGQRLLVAALGTVAWLALVAALAGPWLGDDSTRPWRAVVAVGLVGCVGGTPTEPSLCTLYVDADSLEIHVDAKTLANCVTGNPQTRVRR